MKPTRRDWKLFVCAAALLFFGLAPALAGEGADGAPQTPQEEGPTIAFDAVKFVFDSALDGDLVTHAYAFKNAGTKSLEIKQVKAGCGCTATSYSRSTSPGGEGSVDFRVNTKGYGGRTLHKTVRVVTNDPKNPEVELEISGPVKHFALINPAVIQLRGDEGKEISGTATIVAVEDYPFKIVRTSATAHARFTYSLEEYRNGKEAGWIVTVKDQDPKGRYAGSVYLHTDSKVKPSLEVKVYGSFISSSQTPIVQLPPKGAH